MNSVKVSIVIPVLNAERYIEQCITSVLHQSLQEIEVIVINDGSTDGSKKLISGLAAMDKRIVFIDSSNKGVSAARNKGIKIDNVQYIGFVDADDWVETELYKTLFEKAIRSGSDMAISDVNVVEENSKTRLRLQLNNEVFNNSRNYKKELIEWMRFKYDFSNCYNIY
jgi:glycosyltransferase involved in cell wall biosynthesis